MDNTDLQDFLYLTGLIHSGEYNIRIAWGDVFPLLDRIQTGDVRDCCCTALQQGYTNGCGEDDPFMLLRPPAKETIHPRPELLGRLLEAFRRTGFAFNVAVLLYLQKSLMLGILASFYDHAIDFVDTDEERVLLSMATSPLFLRNDTVVEAIESHLDATDEDLSPLYHYLDQPWFLEFLLIIKNGYYGNGNFNYIDTLESSFRDNFIGGILELVRNGHLVKLLLNLTTFLSDQRVQDRIRGFVSRTETEEKLRGLYDWLSIGNDLAIGLEFLVGSIFFLPGHHAETGVWLFIAGSSQLLIRPVIAIVRKIHLARLYRRKIKF